jgi:hypothetical protein
MLDEGTKSFSSEMRPEVQVLLTTLKGPSLCSLWLDKRVESQETLF